MGEKANDAFDQGKCYWKKEPETIMSDANQKIKKKQRRKVKPTKA
jgi:hypothetical protein